MDELEHKGEKAKGDEGIHVQVPYLPVGGGLCLFRRHSAKRNETTRGEFRRTKPVDKTT
jgi:hypothetical protein